MADQIEKADPRAQFRVKVEAMSGDFLRTMLDGEEARIAAGRVALAFRQAALRTPELYTIDPTQIGYAIAMCAATNLVPGGALPDCWLIPRNAKVKGEDGKDYWIKTLNWQISARGLVKLAGRAGWDLRAVPVFQGERFEAPRGLHEDIIHEPNYDADLDDYDALRLFYVIARRPGSEAAFRIISKAQIEKRRAKAESDKIWKEWPMEQAEKTAVAFAIRRGLVSLEALTTALDAEDRDVAPQAANVVQAPALPVSKHPALVERSSPPRAGKPDDLDDVLPPEPETSSPPASEGAGGEPAPPPPGGDQGEGKARVPPPHPEKDAKALHEALGAEKWKLPVRVGDLKEKLKEKLGAQKMGQERVDAAVKYGVETWGWRIENNGLLPPRSTPAEEPQPHVPVAEKPPAPGVRPFPGDTNGMADILAMEELAGEARVIRIRAECGLSVTPATSWPEDARDRYREALTAELEKP